MNSYKVLTLFFLILTAQLVVLPITAIPNVNAKSNFDSVEMILRIKDMEELGAPCKYNFTRSVIFDNLSNQRVNKTFDEGWLVFDIQAAKYAVLFDNLGNNYQPIIQGNTTKSPVISVEIPPAFSYKLTLKIEPTEYLSPLIGIIPYFTANFSIDVPLNFTVIMPNNYTIINCTSGNQITNIANLTLVNWNIEPYEKFLFEFAFLPFMTEIKDINRWMGINTLTSVYLEAKFPEIFPERSFGYLTIKTTSVMPTKIEGFKINPVFSVTLPIHEGNTTVDLVYDGVGLCEKRDAKIKNVTEDVLGQYYVDLKNKELVVYPRYYQNQEFYEYTVEAHYNLTDTELFFEENNFFTLSKYLTVTERPVPPYPILSEDVSEAICKVVLPRNVVILKDECQPSGVKINAKDDAQEACWIFQLEEHVPLGEYSVVFQIKPIFDGLVLGLLFLVFQILLVTIFYCRKQKIKHLTLFESFTITYVMFLFTTGGTKLLFLPEMILIWGLLFICPFITPSIYDWIRT